jgi:hypothetical protein
MSVTAAISDGRHLLRWSDGSQVVVFYHVGTIVSFDQSIFGQLFHRRLLAQDIWNRKLIGRDYQAL